MNQPASFAMEAKIEGAFISLLSAKPFSAIRVTAIIQECDISHQTFYRYFSSKYDLAVSVFCRQLASAITVGGRDATFREVMTILLSIIKNNSKLYGNLLRDEEGVKMLPDILSQLSENWTGFTPAWATTIINTNILVEWANNRFSTPIEEIYRRFITSLPAYELLSEQELNLRIKQYENLKNSDFWNRKHDELHKPRK